ncbi:MAG: hypothetical protein HC880_10455 [Bacteroidia bacterium]|nr:hypothetical protein [Bacteroidia bacterium]
MLNLNPTLPFDAAGNPITIPTDGCSSCRPQDKENVDNEINFGVQGSLAYYPSESVSLFAKVIHQDQLGRGYDFADNNVNNFTQFSGSGVNELFEDVWTLPFWKAFPSLLPTVQPK